MISIELLVVQKRPYEKDCLDRQEMLCIIKINKSEKHMALLAVTISSRN